MASVRESVTIDKPVEHVFRYVTDPENWTRYVTSLTDVRELSPKTVGPGTAFVWEYRMLGMRFGGKGIVEEHEENRRFSMKMEGNFPIRETFEFTPEGDGTRLTFSIEYEIPNKVLSVVANSSVVESLNAKEVKAVLDKVKVLCEGT